MPLYSSTPWKNYMFLLLCLYGAVNTQKKKLKNEICDAWVWAVAWGIQLGNAPGIYWFSAILWHLGIQDISGTGGSFNQRENPFGENYKPCLQKDDPWNQVLQYSNLEHLFSWEWRNWRHPRTMKCKIPDNRG